MKWYEARDWCLERGIQLATLKTLSHVEELAKEIKKHVKGKKFKIFI